MKKITTLAAAALVASASVVNAGGLLGAEETTPPTPPMNIDDISGNGFSINPRWIAGPVILCVVAGCFDNGTSGTSGTAPATTTGS